MPATYRKTRVLGRIAPGELYTKDGCMRYGGVSEESLSEARRAGIVKPIYALGRSYYRGEQLIAWIESRAK